MQREIAAVRTEIDRIQGRRNFLDRETSLSTITIALTSRSFADFGTSVARAACDSVNVGAGIITGSIRMLGVLLPLVLLIGLPLGLVARFALRRARRSGALREIEKLWVPSA